MRDQYVFVPIDGLPAVNYNGLMGARKHAAWALGLLCAIALPASARAGVWLPPAFGLSVDGSDASEMHVAMDSAGDAVAVWVRNGVVQTAFRPAGGTNSFGGATDMPGASTVASHLRHGSESARRSTTAQAPG